MTKSRVDFNKLESICSDTTKKLIQDIGELIAKDKPSITDGASAIALVFIKALGVVGAPSVAKDAVGQHVISMILSYRSHELDVTMSELLKQVVADEVKPEPTIIV